MIREIFIIPVLRSLRRWGLTLALCISLVAGVGLSPVYAQSVSEAMPSDEDARLTPAQNLVEGILALQQESFESAVDPLSQVIETDSKNSVAYANRCLAYLQLQHYEQAITDCDQALKLQPANTEAYLNRGLAHHRLGQFAEAIADYTQLLRYTPADFRAYYNRGLAHIELTSYREALVDLGASLRQVSPLNREAIALIYTDRGLANLLLEQFPQAIADFTQSLQFNPLDERARFNRGCAYHHQGNGRAARDDFAAVVQHNANHGPALLNLGLILVQQGEKQAAIATLQQAAQCFCQQGHMAEYQQVLSWIERLTSSSMAWG